MSNSMRYLMLICRDERIDFDAEQRAKIGPEVQAWVQEMERRGVRTQGEVLAPVEQATTVRVRSDGVSIGHGPLVRTSEPISGFNLLECADLDEAVEVSAEHPIAKFGTIELRPVAKG